MSNSRKKEQLLRLSSLLPISAEEVQVLAKEIIAENKKYLQEVGQTRPLLGAHTSVGGGLYKALERGAAIGADVVAFFISSPKMWGVMGLLPDSLAKWNVARALTGVEPTNVHGSYLINLASSKKATLDRSIKQIILEATRCLELGVPLYTFHPGARPKTMSEKKAVSQIGKNLTEVLKLLDNKNITICLEATAGSKGNTKQGASFENLRAIKNAVSPSFRKQIGFTIDTCHIWAAGYDISTEEGYENVMSQMVEILGLDSIKAFHLNGCLSTLGGFLDRHAPLGTPPLDITPFRMLMNDKRFRGLPMTLETPNVDEWAAEILMLKGLVGWGTVGSPTAPESLYSISTTQFLEKFHHGATTGASPLAEKESISQVKYGNRAYLLHNVTRPLISWPKGYGVADIEIITKPANRRSRTY